MKTTHRLAQIVAAAGLALLASTADAAPRLAISPFGYQVVQVQPVAGEPHAFDITSRAGVVNLGDPATAVTAHLSSSSAAFIVLDGDVAFGNVPRTPRWNPVISIDTFTLRIFLPQDHSHLGLLEFFRALQRSLTWQLSCAHCGQNRPPVADAGADQTAYVTQTVTLDGSASTDPDGQPLSYAWSFLSRPPGSTASLADASSVRASFVADRRGSYVVQLIVNDGQTSSAPDTVQISTLNSAPVADAGADRTILVGEELLLDGSGSSDIDGDPLSYAWSVASAPPGSQALIADAAQVVARFTADLPGQYIIELIVDDGSTSSAPDAIVLSTLLRNARPVADAGPDQSVRVGDTAQLDGSASSDPDGDPLSYRWSLNARPATSNTALQGETTPNPTLEIDRPGTYVAQLIVSDGLADSDADTVAVSTTNSPPVAQIIAPPTVHWNTIVALDGSGSTDPDGDALGFAWSLLSRPPDSAAALTDPNAVNPSFQADRPGVYVVQLVVNDGTVASAPATASVVAENSAPIARDDAAATAAGTAVDIDVLANDSDPDAEDTLFVQSVTQPASGVVTFTPGGVRYTPAAGFSGSVTFSYTISDGAATATANVDVTVTAGPPVNAAPIAAAGADQSGYAGDVFALDGSASFDPEGAALTYAWSIAGGPPGGATLAGATLANPSLTVGTAGSYSIQLIVNDGALDSTPDFVAVTAVALPTLSISDATVTEGDSGTSVAMLSVSLSAPIDRSVTVSYATADATALAGTDYVAANGTLSFAPGSSAAQTITIDVVGDTDVEPDETFIVTLSSPVNATLAIAQATVTIANDDEATSQGLRLLGPVAALRPGSAAGFVIELDTPAGPGMTALISSSDPAVAQVPASVDFVEGEDSVAFEARAGATVGTAIVSAEIAAVGSATAPFAVSDVTTGALLDQAVAAGEISEEQAFVYRVFAVYSWPGLPARFRGAVRTSAVDPGRRILIELKERYASLSPEAQAQIDPLTIPPIYEGSWGDPAVIAAAIAAADGAPTAGAGIRAAAKLAAVPAQSAAGASIDVTSAVLCRQGSLPQRLPVWGNFQRGPFRIWYLSDPLPYRSFIGTPEQSLRLAEVAAQSIESIYARLNGQFPQQPITATHDSNLAGNPCNGGDGLLDIYMYGYADAGAMTETYFGTSPSPSYVALNSSDPMFRQTKWIQATLAHELMHVIDNLYAKTAGFDESYWISEALGTWAEDFVYGRAPQSPNYQTEHEWADFFFDTVGPGAGQQASVALLSLNDIGDVDDDEAYYGYSKYLFFQFLKRKFENGLPSDALLMERILTNQNRLSSMFALNEALRDRGGLLAVWPQFVAALWNDWQAGVQDDFYRWDSLKRGLSGQFAAAAAPWQPERFGLNGNEERRPLVGNALNDGTGVFVAPAGALWQKIEFTDDSASLVIFDNRTRPEGADRVQALAKVNGQWQELADWTAELYRVWCRDRLAGRLEELVLLYSNAAIPPTGVQNPRAQDWQWYDDEGDRIPNLIASNVGCWKWTGTSSVEVDEILGFGSVAGSNRTVDSFTFELSDEQLELAAATGVANFSLVAAAEDGGYGTSEHSMNGQLGDCTVRGGPEERPMSPLTSGLVIFTTRWLPNDQQAPPGTARLVDAIGAPEDVPRATVSCPESDDAEIAMLFPFWIALFVPDVRLGDDGHALVGTFVNTTLYGARVRTTVNMTAVRE